MSKQVWREFGTIGLGVLFLTSLSVAQPIDQAQNDPVSLFGIRIGTRLPESREYGFIEEDESTLRYGLRNTTNPEYLIQTVNISKQTRVIVSIQGRTPTGPANICQRILSETIAQLHSRYSALRDRVDDVDGTETHLLSMDRPGCSLSVQLTGTSLRVPCSSSFLLYCERQSNAFIIQASDTQYTDLARQEAGALARTPKRNHLD
jgi:hypothetical protein